MESLKLEFLGGTDHGVRIPRLTPALEDLVRLNLERPDHHFPERTKEAALVLCSDSRQPESAFDPEDRFYLVRTAGNLVEPERLPPGIRGVLLVGHEASPGRGCGAVDATAAARRSGRRPSLPDLAHIVDRCGDDTAGNLRGVGAGLAAAGLPAALLMFNHLEATLARLEAAPAPLEEAVAYIEDSVYRYSARDHDPGLQTGGISLKDGQNPPVILVNNLRDSAYRLLGDRLKGKPYTGAMGIFQVKHGEGGSLSSSELASLAYAVDHALRGHGSFKDSGTTIILADDEKGLGALVARLNAEEPRRRTLLDYVHRRDGRIFGVAVEKRRFSRIFAVA